METPSAAVKLLCKRSATPWHKDIIITVIIVVTIMIITRGEEKN